MADTTEPTNAPAREFFIQGITSDGRQFRPSDWAERLCGAMSCFRPEGSGGRNAHLQYSPYVRPALLNGVRSVVVNEDLRQIEPLAYHFVVDFAKDNVDEIIFNTRTPRRISLVSQKLVSRRPHHSHGVVTAL